MRYQRFQNVIVGSPLILKRNGAPTSHSEGTPDYRVLESLVLDLRIPTLDINSDLINSKIVLLTPLFTGSVDLKNVVHCHRR